MNCNQCSQCSNIAIYTGPDNHLYCDYCFNQRFMACSHCGTLVSEGIEANDHCFYCQDCYNKFFTTCYECNQELNPGNIYRGSDDQIYCRGCFNRFFYQCSECDDISNNLTSRRTPRGNYVCDECFNDTCVICSNCGNVLWVNNANYEHDRVYCHGCYRPANEWSMGQFNVKHPHYWRIHSQRKFGLELETSECTGHRDLKDNTIWECKHDCSIDGMEFISPILYGDEGLIEIENFCKIANNKGFRVNFQCGYHAHFDISNESEDSLKSIAYAYRRTYELWCSFVPSTRGENRMCGSPDYICQDIVTEEFDYFVGKRDRFEFVNWRAYLVHGSFEIRLYQGTLDAREICNWIIMHSRFIDAVSKMTFTEIDTLFDVSLHNQYLALSKLIGSEMAIYWTDKVECLKNLLRGGEYLYLK